MKKRVVSTVKGCQPDSKRETQYGGFPKIRSTVLGSPIIRILVFWVSTDLGPPN